MSGCRASLILFGATCRFAGGRQHAKIGQTQIGEIAAKLLTSIVYHAKFSALNDIELGEGVTMTATKLGRVQLLIMQFLWSKGRATAREITDALNQSEP